MLSLSYGGRKDLQPSTRREHIMGKHSSGIRSPRDFRARSGRTARDAYEVMMERLRWERRVGAMLAMVPCH